MQQSADVEEQARSLLGSYLEEVAPITIWQRIRPTNHPSGRAILAAEPGLQLSVVEQALTLAAELRALETHSYNHEYNRLACCLRSLLQQLAKRPLPYESLDSVLMLGFIARNVHSAIPCDLLLDRLARVLASRPLSAEGRAALRELREAPNRGLGEPMESDRNVMRTATKLLDGTLLERPAIEWRDDWGKAARQSLGAMPEPEAARWLDVLRHAETLRSEPPAENWLSTARERIAALGEDAFRVRAEEWLGLLALPLSGTTYDDASGRMKFAGAVAESNRSVLRGLAWCCICAPDARLAASLHQAAERCQDKVFGHGPRSLAVARTCQAVLATWPTPSSGAGH